MRTGPKPQPTEERFWPKVALAKPDECWEWTACKNRGGYGTFMVSRSLRKNVLAHRYSWELRNGPIPPGLNCLHRCDNPGCVNPDHLFIGTLADNNRDMAEKGRRVPPPILPGEANHSAKLTRKKVRAIRAKSQAGRTGVSLAEEYGVYPSTIGRIINRENWTHI